MAKKDTKGKSTKELRRLAESMFQKKTQRTLDNNTAHSPEENQQLIHELQVHQIELELQNEELRRAQVELDDIRARYFDLYDLAPVGYFTLNDKGIIIETNLSSSKLLKANRDTMLKKVFTQFIFKDDQDIYYHNHNLLIKTGMSQICELRMIKTDGSTFWARLETNNTPNLDSLPIHRVVVSDITKSKKLEEELQKALKEIKTLHGIIPICSNCKKIRDDQGYWEQVEIYVSAHSKAKFSHGLCPDCIKKLYPNFKIKT